MKKKLRYFTCALALGLAVALGTGSMGNAYASIQNKIDNAQSEIDDLKNKANEAENKIEAAEEKKKELEKVVQEMDKELTAAMTEYNTLAEEQDTLEAEIAATEVKLEEAAEKEVGQYEDMKLRIQYMYEVGNQSYLELLMSSENIVDFINNAAYIVELSVYDRQMLNTYQETKQQIADDKKLLEDDNARLTVLVDEAKDKFDEVNRIVEDKQEQVDAYKAEIARLENSKEIYEDEIEEQTAIIAELEKQAQAQIQAPPAQSKPAENNSSAPSQDNSNQNTSSGGFVWPVPASRTITSDYGYRDHPSSGRYHFHSGIDIAASTGSSILAASGGVVTSAGWNSSMGNYVMISHGNGLVTIYMHASVLCVSSGQSVSAGQQIALVGSTGDSTGPHLHFSVRLNGSYVSPWNYL